MRQRQAMGNGQWAIVGAAWRLCRPFFRFPIWALLCFAPGLLPAQTAPPLTFEEGPESLRLRLTNAPGGLIEGSADRGQTWRTLGQVVTPANAVNPHGYTASGWAQDSSIAATAVNAIHIRVSQDPSSGRTIIFSLVPGGKTVGAARDKRSADIFTDICGGEGIFGGGLGPYVNSKVYLAKEPPVPLPANYVPAEGDVLLIIRRDPVRLPYYATFENRVGGAIELDYGDGKPVRIGVVDRPVTGIGRFEGGIYGAPGRIRANHPGVIDISTAPRGMVGGFQIIPREHAASPEMSYVKTGTQWMIVGPDKPEARPWTGAPPFFSEYILPSYRADDIIRPHADWMQRVLSRTQVLVRYNDGPWEIMPRIAFVRRNHQDNEAKSQSGRRGWWLIPAELNTNRPLSEAEKQVANRALAGVTHLRIVFPRSNFWPQ